MEEAEEKILVGRARMFVGSAWKSVAQGDTSFLPPSIPPSTTRHLSSLCEMTSGTTSSSPPSHTTSLHSAVHHIVRQRAMSEELCASC